jgi:T5SS/PEP-CTERM-associated repeat protein
MNPIGRQGIRCISIVLLVVGLVLVPPPSRGQLVSDGRTNILDGVSTNFSGDIVVGNINRFTLLVLTNGATVSNTNGSLIIGQNSSSSNNAVIITGAGSAWSNGGMQVGYFGSANRLSILNGGAVLNSGVCTVGSTSQSNVVLVTDAGSLFRNSSIVLSASGSGNQLIVSNGAVVSADSTYTWGSNTAITLTGASSWLTNQYDFQSGGISNALTITDGAALADSNGQIRGLGNRVVVDGPQSFWRNDSDLSIGHGGARNLIIITNGAKLFDGVGYIGYAGSSNTVVVAGAGSFWTNRSGLYVGYDGSSCRLFITNGGSVVSPYTYVGESFSSVSNEIIVADPGSVWKTVGNISIGANGFGGNGVIISNSGTVLAAGLSASYETNGFNILISGGNLIVTNSIQLLGRGPSFFTLDSGLVAADYLDSFQTTFDFRAGTLQLHQSQVTGTNAFEIGDGARQATLELLNYGSHNFLSRSLVVSSNAMLKGVGTIWANVTVSNGGTLSPSPSWGSSVGSMIVFGNLLLSPGSTNLMGLNGTGNYAKFDYFVGISNITYAGTLLLTNISGQLTQGSSFRLYSASNYSGAFSAIMPRSPGPALKWNTNELTVDGVLRVVALHPAPPTITGVQSSRTNLQIRASGGVPYDPCYLLTTTNIQSAAAWEFCDTNRFDSAGVSIFNRAISPTEKERYFRLQVQ